VTDEQRRQAYEKAVLEANIKYGYEHAAVLMSGHIQGEMVGGAGLFIRSSLQVIPIEGWQPPPKPERKSKPPPPNRKSKSKKQPPKKTEEPPA
jgi:hypothetical protein